MKLVAKLLTLIALITISPQAMADVPPELQQNFRGTGNTYNSFIKGKGPKLSFGLRVLNETDAVLTVYDQDGLPGDEIAGETIYIPELKVLVAKFEIDPGFSLSGTYKIKGKPGKFSMNGNLQIIQGGFVGFGGFKMKLKQALPL